MRADYKCEDCSSVFEFKTEIGEGFPLSAKCSKCGSMNTVRKFSVDGIYVSQGMVGNSHNGYTAKS